ncbi:serine/threonine-protein kinase HipA [Sphingomonas sp. SORGH_AS870]|uniref:type II toxin-antitoxin system HipA family toxin n=1 Tax=Sphingomonas sp. SORGH_AS_0870 TaxID=3041801 RepID=UPI0028569AC6|nr:HipA domain-containing protein [Sphingomonas sp. SORGH_AS_0870]MDR6144351.1 serine/threonine-protein kinase HipA [Sphingomonas sp. SORGH_AS_0870]
MKLRPGAPLGLALAFDDAMPAAPAGRVVMAGGVAQLEWSPDVIRGGLPVAPLLYPPEPGLHAARSRSFGGLHGFLADSLPDAWGRLLLRRRLARIDVQFDTLNPVDQLAIIGAGGRGALVYQPATTPDDAIGTIDLDALAEESRLLLAGDEGALVDTLAALGGASGGARPKVHVGFAPDGAISVGKAADGHDAWIVKFRATGDPVDIGPVEEAYTRMARAAGLTIAESRVLPERDGPGYFATRRFDRPAPGRRLHMVSLAGAAEAPSEMPSLDYDGFLRATLAITRHAGDVEQAFRRMVFNVLAHNRDDHTRQHSYLMGPSGEWRLAPAYDLTFSVGPGGEHYLAVEGEGRTPTRAHVLALGRRHGLSDRVITQIIDRTRGALAEWPVIAADVGVTVSRREIADRLKVTDDHFG